MEFKNDIMCQMASEALGLDTDADTHTTSEQGVCESCGAPSSIFYETLGFYCDDCYEDLVGGD